MKHSPHANACSKGNNNPYQRSLSQVFPDHVKALKFMGEYIVNIQKIIIESTSRNFTIFTSTENYESSLKFNTMADLSTVYMGIALKNPIIVGASNMSQKVENLSKIEHAGPGL